MTYSNGVYKWFRLLDPSEDSGLVALNQEYAGVNSGVAIQPRNYQ